MASNSRESPGQASVVIGRVEMDRLLRAAMNAAVRLLVTYEAGAGEEYAGGDQVFKNSCRAAAVGQRGDATDEEGNIAQG